MLRCSIAPRSWLERRYCPKLAPAPGQAAFHGPSVGAVEFARGLSCQAPRRVAVMKAVAHARRPLRIEALAPWTARARARPSTFCPAPAPRTPCRSRPRRRPRLLALRSGQSVGQQSRRPTMRSISRPSGATTAVGTTSMGTLRVRPSALSLDVDEAQRWFVPHHATIFRQHVAAIELTPVAASRRPSSFHGRQANGRAMHECGSRPRFASTLRTYHHQLARQTLDRTASPDPPASWDRRLCRA